MPVLFQEEPAKGTLFPRLQWWTLGSYTALVSYGEEMCAIFVYDDKHYDLTETIIRYINDKLKIDIVAHGIWSPYIHIAIDELDYTLNLIEKAVLSANFCCDSRC